MRCDHGVPAPEELSRDELIALVGAQAERIALLEGQISGMAGQMAQLLEANEAMAGKLARLEHLLSRNSGNSSSPPSKDDEPGRTVSLVMTCHRARQSGSVKSRWVSSRPTRRGRRRGSASPEDASGTPSAVAAGGVISASVWVPVAARAGTSNTRATRSSPPRSPRSR